MQFEEVYPLGWRMDGMVSGVDEYFQQERISLQSCMHSLVVLLDVVEGVAATAGEG